MKRQKRILIARPDRIGDVVLSTGIPREIKKKWRNSFVAVLVRKYTADIFLNNPNVDEIIVLDDVDDSTKSFFKKVSQIRNYKFTHSLSLLPTERLNYLLFFAGIPYRVGVSHKFYQFITWTKFVSRNKYIPLRHEADYCMDLARKIGVETTNYTPEIFLSKTESELVQSLRSKILAGKKYLVGVHITSGNSAPNMPLPEYRKFIDQLSIDPEIQVVVTDNNIPDEFINEHSHFINKSKSLRESIIGFASMDCLVSASTGPMHIASALGIKTVSLFCPLTACSPKLWGPLGNESEIILPEEWYCKTKCPGDPKKCRFEGDGGINSEKIIERLKGFLKQT